jgi:hypothetical protein
MVIKITTLAGANSVLSGLFFDQAPNSTASASLPGRGTTTQGNAIAAYGNSTIIAIGTVDFSSSDSQALLPAGQRRASSSQ